MERAIICLPIEFDELTLKIRRLLEHRNCSGKIIFRREVNRGSIQNSFEESAMQRIHDMVKQISATDGTILYRKSGTGKGWWRGPVHADSLRRQTVRRRQLRAIPEFLIERLFGHKKGFTARSRQGGYQGRRRWNAVARRISEMPVHLQVGCPPSNRRDRARGDVGAPVNRCTLHRHHEPRSGHGDRSGGSARTFYRLTSSRYACLHSERKGRLSVVAPNKYAMEIKTLLVLTPM